MSNTKYEILYQLRNMYLGLKYVKEKKNLIYIIVLFFLGYYRTSKI